MALNVHNLTPEKITELRTNVKYERYFEDDLKFSRRYALTGPNQEHVLKLFTPELSSAFTGSEKRWAASGIDNQLMLFTDDTLDEQLKPEEFIDYLKKTWEIFEITRSRNSGREIK